MNVRQAKISVLIACFNAQSFVSETVNSLLLQTVLPDEIIIVNDGSTDGSVDEIKSFLDRGVTLIEQENKGAACARNRAFAASTGQFVIFVDADDIVGPRHLESLLARVASTDRFVALSRWDRFYIDPDEARFPPRSTERDMNGVDWLMLDWKAARPMTQSGMLLIPRVLVEEHGGWNEDLSLIDDFEFFARIISHSDGVRFAPEAKLYYRSGRPGTLSGGKTRKAVESAFTSIMLGTSHVLAVRDDPQTRRVCANILKDFDYNYYPNHSDLLVRVRDRIDQLGGFDLEPDGPPGFQKLRRWTGWKIARRAQQLSERYRSRRGVYRQIPSNPTPHSS